MEENKAKIICEMLAISGFTELDATIWTKSFSNGEEVYVQQDNHYWEVYFKNDSVKHTDTEMIAGLTVLLNEIIDL